MNEPILMRTDPVIMGIVNVTPDSFSDGGLYLDTKSAIEHGLRLCEEGASILDIGGESTRPGAQAVSAEEEQRRVIPVLHALKSTGIPLSIDTRNALTMQAAIDAGASIVNDVSALTHDPQSLAVVAETGVQVCLMHMKGTPQTMQDAPAYGDVFAEVYAYLENRIDACLRAGVRRERIVIDPGIGFGKTLQHNLVLLNRIGDFAMLGCPVMLGASRKKFIDSICSGIPTDRRLPGSLAACISAWERGVHLFRVHDVAETVQALAVFRRIQDAGI